MQDEHEEYQKEKAFIGWEKEVKEHEFMNQILGEEIENQVVVTMKSPKLVLGKRKKSNSFDYGNIPKFPRFIKSRNYNSNDKADIQYIY